MDKINLIILAAGRGTRFINSEWIEPKPLISWDGRNMIEHVINNFVDQKIDITVIGRKGHSFQSFGSKVIEIDYTTEGPASTAYLAKDSIDPNSELIITNCDQIIKDWNLDLFIRYARQFDGCFGCFISNHQKNSYVQIDENNLVKDVKEKQVISNLATNGLHYWNKASDFFESYEQMVKNEDKTNGEYYVAPTYNYLIKNNQKIGIYLFNQHFPIGTPDDLKKYLQNGNIQTQ
jgi:NDP-sugar pyrophosphorylase family protein